MIICLTVFLVLHKMSLLEKFLCKFIYLMITCSTTFRMLHNMSLSLIALQWLKLVSTIIKPNQAQDISLIKPNTFFRVNTLSNRSQKTFSKC